MMPALKFNKLNSMLCIYHLILTTQQQDYNYYQYYFNLLLICYIITIIMNYITVTR